MGSEMCIRDRAVSRIPPVARIRRYMYMLLNTSLRIHAVAARCPPPGGGADRELRVGQDEHRRLRAVREPFARVSAW